VKYRPGPGSLTGIAIILLLVLVGCARTSARSVAVEDPRIVAIAAIQNYLAGEHAAIWAYGRAAPLLPKDEVAAALREIVIHKKERDRLGRELRAALVEPVGALVAYEVPGPLANATDARVFLAGVEARLTLLALTVKNIPAKP
jgi:hypothetical protein